MDSYYGEIRLFAGTYAPLDWAFCAGQILQIQQYNALYSVIGNQYGGDGISTFALPNLQGTLPLNHGTGVGLTPWAMAQTRGATLTALNINNLPNHNHQIAAYNVAGNSESPTGNIFAARGKNDFDFTSLTPNATMNQQVVGVAGSLTPAAIDLVQPYLTLNYIISLQGPVYPTRP